MRGGGALKKFAEQADKRVVVLDDSSRWSFRRRARAWLASAGQRPGVVRAEERGTSVLVMEDGRLGANQTVDRVLLVRGSFSCGAGCRFLRPVYVAGDCHLGKETLAESVEADGSLLLSPGVRVERVAGSLGELELRSGCAVAGIAYSHTLIRFGGRSSAKQLLAPMVATLEPVSRAGGVVQPQRAIEIPNPAHEVERSLLRLAGMDAGRLQPLSPDSWLYRGDLHLMRPVVCRGHLMVDGCFSCRAASLLEGDVRASGSVEIGEHSVARKDLSAGGDLVLHPRCVFQGDLRAEQMIQLGSGVRGLRRRKAVSVWAAGSVALGAGVVIRGRIASSCRVSSRVSAACAPHAKRAENC